MSSNPLPSNPLETLRQVNRNLRSTLARLRPERSLCSTIKPQDFSDIDVQLLRASECLRSVPPSSQADAEFEKESLAYRDHLQELKRFLPDVKVRLLAEKARLETVRNHLLAAASWERASKKTL
jgi:hypothetical protein